MNFRNPLTALLRLLADLGTPARASRQRKTDEAKAYGWREFALDGPQDFDDEPLDIWPRPGGDPNSELTRVGQVDDRGTAAGTQAEHVRVWRHSHDAAPGYICGTCYEVWPCEKVTAKVWEGTR